MEDYGKKLKYVAISEVLRIMGDVAKEGYEDFVGFDKTMARLVLRASDAAYEAYEYCLAQGCQKAGEA